MESEKFVHINVFKEHKDKIEASSNKSESYIIQANEELNNSYRELLSKNLEIENNISELENDNERMEKSITYQRGLLHNFNHIKNYQEQQLKLHRKFKTEVSKTQNFLVNENIKQDKMTIFNIIVLCILSFAMSPYDLYDSLFHTTFNIICIVSTFYVSKLVFSYDKNNIISNMENYKLNEKEFNERVSNIEKDIKNITSKSDFISDLIDNS